MERRNVHVARSSEESHAVNCTATPVMRSIALELAEQTPPRRRICAVRRVPGTAAAAVLATLAFLQRPSAATDWPCYRGPLGDGVVTEKGLLVRWPDAGPRRLWTVTVASSNGTHSGPAIVGGRVFVAGKDGKRDLLHCLDPADGHELWVFGYESYGNISWGSGPRATPTVSDGMVYLLGALNVLHCVDAAKGTKVWSRDLNADFDGEPPKFGAAAAPLVEGELVVCEPGGKGAGVVALNRKTGEEIWRSGDWPAAYAAPQAATICGVRQILVYPAWGAAGLDPASGRELWGYRFDDQKNAGTPLVVGDLVCTGNISWGMTGRRLSRTGGVWKVEKTWQAEGAKLHTSSPVVDRGHAYFYDLNAKLNCIDLADGSVKWSRPSKPEMPPDLDHHANVLLLDAGKLLVNYSDGEVALVEVSPGGCEDRGRFRAVGRTAFAPAAVADGRLYVRDQRVLSCFELRAE